MYKGVKYLIRSIEQKYYNSKPGDKNSDLKCIQVMPTQNHSHHLIIIFLTILALFCFKVYCFLLNIALAIYDYDPLSCMH